jgi:hypothetical protein
VHSITSVSPVTSGLDSADRPRLWNWQVGTGRREPRQLGLFGVVAHFVEGVGHVTPIRGGGFTAVGLLLADRRHGSHDLGLSGTAVNG